jgi:hypothetical protein
VALLEGLTLQAELAYSRRRNGTIFHVDNYPMGKPPRESLSSARCSIFAESQDLAAFGHALNNAVGDSVLAHNDHEVDGAPIPSKVTLFWPSSRYGLSLLALFRSRR